MKTKTKITVEQVNRPDYEGGGIAYQVFTHAFRGGKDVKIGTDRTGIYSDAVKIAKINAKRLKCDFVVCNPV